MNHKQKLGYTLLGAGIMALGIIIGQFSTPDIEAQSNGVFDKVICHRLEVVDKHGKAKVILAAEEEQGNGVFLYDKKGKVMIALATFDEDKENGNGIYIYDQRGKIAMGLVSNLTAANDISIFDRSGTIRTSMNGFGISVYDKDGNFIWTTP